MDLDAGAVVVRAPRERVWDAFATAEGWNAWFTRVSSWEATAGAKMRFARRAWGAEARDLDEEGEVVEAVRPSRFVFRWHPEDPGQATKVEATFEEHPQGTLMRLRERGFRTEEGRVQNAAGWGEALALLRVWLEHGVRYRVASSKMLTCTRRCCPSTWLQESTARPGTAAEPW